MNDVEAGLGYLSTDTFHFGRYVGVTDEGAFAILKGTFDGGDPWDSPGRMFWDANINVYGFDKLSFHGRYGEQGLWRVSAFYEGFTRAFTDSARSPFEGAGSDRLVLPDSWTGGVSSAQFESLEGDFNTLPLKVEWQEVGGDFVYIPKEGYQVRLAFSHRIREGTREQSATFGHEANFPVGVFFPQPVDYETSRFNLSLEYADPRWQWTASYELSAFTNKIESVSVPNPYSRSLGIPWPAGAFAGFPFAAAGYGLPPDSAAHQFAFSTGYALTPRTRLTATLSYTLQLQNDVFLPYTENEFLLVPTPLPRDSLDGLVHKTRGTLRLMAREWRDVDISASYTFDDRNNNSPQDLYSYVANDVQDQPQPAIPGNSRYIRFNLPHGFTFHKLRAEIGYRPFSRTRLSLAYSGDLKSRTLQQVEETTEHQFTAKVRANFGRGSVWAAYDYADRTGTAYRDALPWDESHTESYLNASPFTQSIEHPLLRKYHLADRRRHEARGGLTLNVTNAVGVNLSGRYGEDSHVNSEIGLRNAERLRFDTDVSYFVAEWLTASAFYSLEKIDLEQNGYLMFGLDEANPDQAWSAHSRDTVHTAGLRIDWQAIPGKLDITANYYVLDGINRIAVDARPFNVLTVTEHLPDARDITHHLTLSGEYAFRPDTSVRLGYTAERHISKNWQYDDLGVAPVAQILGAGIVPPRYTAHAVWVTAHYRF